MHAEAKIQPTDDIAQRFSGISLDARGDAVIPPKQQRRVGFVADSYLLESDLHACDDHPEHPRRVRALRASLLDSGLLDSCISLPALGVRATAVKQKSCCCYTTADTAHLRDMLLSAECC
jgi:hypothetical protein